MTHVDSRTATLVTVLAVLLFLLPGCLEMEQGITLEKSGKGTATMNVVIDQKMVKQMQEMMGGMMGGQGQGPADPADEMSPEKAKEILKGNDKVRLLEAKSELDEETQKLTMYYKVEFDSPRDLWESGLVANVNAKLEKLDNGNYRFTSTMQSEGMPQDAASMEQAKQMMMPMLEPFMKGFKTVVSLQLPTAVLETNGKKEGETKVVFTMDFEGMFDVKNHKQTVTFTGEGLDWKPFTLTASDIAKSQQERKAAAEKPTTPSTPAPPAPAR